jgi:murein DD-endopeptidase MepM/ murein hydrolase activator NlpD
MKWPLEDISPAIPPEGHVGDFAFRRSFYHHPGIDLYCPIYTIVQAIEDGEVVHIEHFTGANANPPSPWWNDTWSVLIEGESGVIGYCELQYDARLTVGARISAGEIVGAIIPVLKKDKGNGTTMLHLEQYVHGTKHHVTWVLDTEKPAELLNPRPLLEKIYNDYVSNSK